eukprot:jgi/Mesen1/10962/ME000096S10546
MIELQVALVVVGIGSLGHGHDDFRKLLPVNSDLSLHIVEVLVEEGMAEVPGLELEGWGGANADLAQREVTTELVLGWGLPWEGRKAKGLARVKEWEQEQGEEELEEMVGAKERRAVVLVKELGSGQVLGWECPLEVVLRARKARVQEPVGGEVGGFLEQGKEMVKAASKELALVQQEGSWGLVQVLALELGEEVQRVKEELVVVGWEEEGVMMAGVMAMGVGETGWVVVVREKEGAGKEEVVTLLEWR